MISHPRDDLGAYALGALDPAERRSIEAHLEACDECRSDLAAHDDALWAVAESVATAPPARLRARIVRDARPARRPVIGGWLVPRRVPIAVPLALSVVLVASLVGLAAARRDADAYAQALAGVASGRVVSLGAAAEAQRARGALVVPASGRPYLLLDVAAPPSGRAWEAWVLRGDRAIAAGLGETRGGIVTVVLTEPLVPGDAVAVTLEDARGAQQPTSAPVLVGKL